MFNNLLHVLLNVGHDVGHLLTVVFRQLVGMGPDKFGEIAEQLIVHLTEVDDKVQWVLNLMGNAGTEQT